MGSSDGIMVEVKAFDDKEGADVLDKEEKKDKKKGRKGEDDDDEEEDEDEEEVPEDIAHLPPDKRNKRVS